MTELLLLAVDQRPWLTQELFGHTGRASPAERAFAAEAKHMVLDGLLMAIADRPNRAAGILVDDLLGPGVPERARAHRLQLALPIELGAQRIYQTEPKDLPAFLDHHRPDHVKVLVRYNPEDPAEERTLQRERLAEAAEATHAADANFLFELLVPPTPRQQEALGERGFADARADLTATAMRELADEIEVDIWKLEPQAGAAAYRLLRETADEHGAGCLLLGGSGHGIAVVEERIAQAAAEGFRGFAVGRAIWWHSVQRLRDDLANRSAGVAEIAERYRLCLQAHLGAWGQE